MIGSLKGRLLAVEPPMILLDVHGVGFELQLPLSDLSDLPAVGGELKVSTQLVQREDELSLYGFRKTADRAWFRELIRVPGIGPKLALNIVSQSGVAEFAEQIQAGDVKALTRLPGIGPKTAGRLIVEMRGRLEAVPVQGESSAANLALKALTGLGYTPVEAARMLKQVGEPGGRDVEELVREALSGGVAAS
ncbi:MAG: Holliday junction branch migration protein RuvA [Gammaproteobacteria bacterium]|nr:Holliday junction branch migration protein RuvA [Gammaproteobacteria bacterium]MXW46943.1 Holliday junction branch migration protein RuvA [Gammaproteobacteria bacterium]MYD02834.1 Holliday junction branch migration protein RuvA [Gammaproteobacteria bacterium]MYI24411.1 Holliday junction branch migration protein RuvA [Gammaproteobacteria bacterium]